MTTVAAHGGESVSFQRVTHVAQWRLLLGLVASVAFMVAALQFVDLRDLRRALDVAPQQPLTLIAAFAAYSAAFWLRAMAWQRLLNTPVSTGRLFSILQASLFLNHLLPVKAGEVARPAMLVGKGVAWPEAVSTTLIARVLDVAALALIAAVTLPLAGGSLLYAAVVPGIALFAGVALLLVAPRLLRLVDLLPSHVAVKLSQLRGALAGVRKRTVIEAAPLVVVSWLLESSALLAAARLLGMDISPSLALGATCFTILFQVVHITPGGVGIYETSMTSILALQNVPPEQALLLAVVTHGLKFAYSFSVGTIFAVGELVALLRGRAETAPKRASSVEIAAARAWNVLNEGKPFTPVFTVALLIVLALPHGLDGAYWLRLGGAMLAVLPLALLFFRYDFPLHLRTGLWVMLGAFLVLFRYFDPVAALVTIAVYHTFTVFMWGTVYYHLRIGTRWTNFLRFWRLVLENPDPTSGNLQEQLPKVLMLLLATHYLVAQDVTLGAVAGIEAFTLAAAVGALLLHQWLFTWVPALPQPIPAAPETPLHKAKRVIVIAIDGCRADRLIEARTPYIDSLRRSGADYTNVSTVYPARTVTCFTSMLTGAPASVHGMHSNFVPSLGVKCDSVFESLERGGLKGRMVGIAHLIDSFGEDNVKTVTAVMHNDEIDDALVARAKLVMEEEAPDLLVLQLLSVDQTGHARGSYYPEYLRKIEITDRIIQDFVSWCDARGFMDETTLLITADHGQGVGIGGHGHMSPPEITIPCILWGEGVQPGLVSNEPRFITDIASTICDALGVPQPAQSVGTTLLTTGEPPAEQPTVFVLPARNEAQNLPTVLAAIARTDVGPKRVVVVDDGSTDETAAVARSLGASVVSHERTRGLGAALRTGLLEARRLNARAAVYLDADCEYDATEAPRLLAAIERGEADYVLGSRFMGRPQGMTAARRVANRAFSLLLSLACGRWISDGQTGFRAFSRRALDVAEIVHDYNYAQVLTLNLLHKGMRMQEVDISYQRRGSGRSFVTPQYLWRVPTGMLREMLND